jgi:hypothetical protein
MKTPAFALLVMLAAAAFGDKWMAPRPRFFTSENGVYALKVVPLSGESQGRSKATLVTLDDQGNEHQIWSSKLVNIPAAALVLDSGRVVTLDTYGSIGYQHAVTVYGDRGQPISDYRLEDLLSPKEIEDIPVSVSSRWWSTGRTLTHMTEGESKVVSVGGVRINRPEKESLRILLKSGTAITVDLATGKVIGKG